MNDKNENEYELQNKNYYAQTREVEFEEDEYGDDIYEDYDYNDNDNEDNSNNDIIRLATNISVVDYAIRILYNNRYLLGMGKMISSPKKLSLKEIEELEKHELKSTKSSKVFKYSNYNSISSTSSTSKLLFYRTNHAWYWTKCPCKANDDKYKNINYMKKLKWTIIRQNDIEETSNNDYNNHSEKEKAIIIFLKLTGMYYLTDYKKITLIKKFFLFNKYFSFLLLFKCY